MEHLDLVEGFDSENTSQYSMVNPLPNIGQALSTTYTDIKNVLESGYNDVTQAVQSAIEGAKDINIRDFYASGPISTALRDTMQNPELEKGIDDAIRYARNLNMGYVPIPVPHRKEPLINYNSLVLVIVILILFFAWKYWTKRN
jgi:hypothetical protein